MTKRDQKRIARELAAGLRDDLLACVARFPDYWDGNEIRALAVEIVERNYAGRDWRRRLASMKRDAAYFCLPR